MPFSTLTLLSTIITPGNNARGNQMGTLQGSKKNANQFMTQDRRKEQHSDRYLTSPTQQKETETDTENVSPMEPQKAASLAYSSIVKWESLWQPQDSLAPKESTREPIAASGEGAISIHPQGPRRKRITGSKHKVTPGSYPKTMKRADQPTSSSLGSLLCPPPYGTSQKMQN